MFEGGSIVHALIVPNSVDLGRLSNPRGLGLEPLISRASKMSGSFSANGTWREYSSLPLRAGLRVACAVRFG
jgi:hypothetical protein